MCFASPCIYLKKMTLYLLHKILGARGPGFALKIIKHTTCKSSMNAISIKLAKKTATYNTICELSLKQSNLLIL